jgi:hypothetical protein
MLYCPRCEYVFGDNLAICPDCNVALVEQKTLSGSAAEIPDRSWVKVWGVRTNNRAERAKIALDTHNIPSVILGSSFDGKETPKPDYAAMAASPGDLTIIMVPREFREEAEWILESALGDDEANIDF